MAETRNAPGTAATVHEGEPTPDPTEGKESIMNILPSPELDTISTGPLDHMCGELGLDLPETLAESQRPEAVKLVTVTDVILEAARRGVKPSQVLAEYCHEHGIDYEEARS